MEMRMTQAKSPNKLCPPQTDGRSTELVTTQFIHAYKLGLKTEIMPSQWRKKGGQ
jgi:hypothetical protein